jgi:4-amino-4-deoxy-L-arabinose transferase-like glycosyltransferase
MPFDREQPSRPLRSAALLLILAIAAAARLWHVKAGVPHAVGIDEPQVVDRALHILTTGDWNPHVFDYPTLVIYVQAFVAIGRFLWGALGGEWSSLDGFSIVSVYTAGRTVAALIGVATVWLTYKLGVELGSRRVALLGAALMAVRPMHVRESHVILTDVPMTALTTLAMWFSLRAARLGTVRAYAWAGAICGLAAAANYPGGIALVALLVAWAIHERSSPGRGRKLGAAIAAAALAFLIGAPYTPLDLPQFLDGFAAQFARFALPSQTSDPAWLAYVKHLWVDGGFSVPLALAGAVLVLARRDTRARWAPVLAMAAACFYELSTHSHVFGRYAIPLLPVLCLLASYAALEVAAVLQRIPALASVRARAVVLALIVIALMYQPTVATARWLKDQRRGDTRAIAAAWLRANTPARTRVAVESSGPTYLGAAGMQVVPSEPLFERDANWYRGRADYLVISATDLSPYGDLLNAGRIVFQIAPTPQRGGPPIRIVQLRN